MELTEHGIYPMANKSHSAWSRTPHDTKKSHDFNIILSHSAWSRTPHGVRGFKYCIEQEK